MASRDDEQFRPKVGAPKARGRASQPKFISRVLKATSRAGRTIGRTLRSQPPPHLSRRKNGRQFGRGQVAARVAGRHLDARARRVAVKTRLVNLRRASPRSTQLHLRYIERDGVTRDGQRGQLFDARNDSADADGFEHRGQHDRHQFRMIVSPEDGHELGDLRSFARDLMSQVERDLGTKLDWVGVDHWDTDQPHIHIVLRGKDEHGDDLVIAPEYIAHGMRARSSELSTAWLGRRSELEIHTSLKQEVQQERWTSLDRMIMSNAVDLEITVRGAQAINQDRFETGLLIGRLARLEQMGLARKIAPLHYQVSSGMESTLRAMGERSDIIRTMQRAMSGAQREFTTFDHTKQRNRIVGRVAGSGIADELSCHGYLIVDGVDGRAHYVALPADTDVSTMPKNSIVEVRAGHEPTRVDQNIKAMTENGIYREETHRAIVKRNARADLDPDAYVQSHVRRLEALRRAGIVERIEPAVWRVPNDFVQKANEYEAQRATGALIRVRSALPIEQQVKAVGATWLDHQLVGKLEASATHGFGAKVRDALNERTQFLIDQKLAERRGQRVVFVRDLITTLRDRELESLARRIEGETGLPYRPSVEGKPNSGVYRQSFVLASGRFAMLDDATGFSLVPWRPVVEQRIGQPLCAIVRGDFVSWEVGKNRGLSR